MLKTPPLCLLIFLLLAGCREIDDRPGTDMAQNWSLKLETPSEGRITELGTAIYREFYDGRAILYARFGKWDTLYIHGYVPKSQSAIAQFVGEKLGGDLMLEFGAEYFPDTFASLAACTAQTCHAPDQCVRTFEGKGENPLDVTGQLIREAVVRGYPIAGVFFKGTSKAYKIEVPFYADCDQADTIMAKLRALRLTGVR